MPALTFNLPRGKKHPESPPLPKTPYHPYQIKLHPIEEDDNENAERQGAEVAVMLRVGAPHQKPAKVVDQKLTCLGDLVQKYLHEEGEEDDEKMEWQDSNGRPISMLQDSEGRGKEHGEELKIYGAKLWIPDQIIRRGQHAITRRSRRRSA
jgi:hypothetical protein